MLLELLNKTSLAAILAFVLTTMLAIGLGHSVGQILVSLGNIRLVLLTLLVNFVAMPLCSLGLATVLHLDEPLAEGLILLGAASGAPVLPPLVELAKGNLPFAVGTTILLAIVTLAYRLQLLSSSQNPGRPLALDTSGNAWTTEPGRFILDPIQQMRRD